MAVAEYNVTYPGPHPAQAKVLREAKRNNVLAMGRRWGKTHLGILLALLTLLKGRDVIWLAPQNKYLMEAWRRAKRALEPITVEKSEVEKRIEVVGGAAIYFMSLEDPDAGRSYAFGRVIYDEAAKARHLEENFTEAIALTMLDHDADVWFLSSPKGKDYFYELWMRGQSDDYPDWASWQLPTGSNPLMTAEKIKALIEQVQLPPHAVRQEIDAEFIDAHGVYVQRDWFEIVDQAPALKYLYRAWDPAWSSDKGDYSVGLLGGMDERGIVYLLDVIRLQVESPELYKAIEGAAKSDPEWTGCVVAKTAGGLPFFQMLQRSPAFGKTPLIGYQETGRVRPDQRESAKLARAAGWIAGASQGRIKLVRGAWNEPFVSELVDFRNDPNTDTDDQWDALTILWDTLYRTVGAVERDTEPPVGSLKWLRQIARQDQENDDEDDWT